MNKVIDVLGRIMFVAWLMVMPALCFKVISTENVAVWVKGLAYLGNVFVATVLCNLVNKAICREEK